jgi:hypothetical protein
MINGKIVLVCRPADDVTIACSNFCVARLDLSILNDLAVYPDGGAGAGSGIGSAENKERLLVRSEQCQSFTRSHRGTSNLRDTREQYCSRATRGRDAFATACRRMALSLWNRSRGMQAPI